MNDNRFVEQKNYTLVRAYLGYGRLETRRQCEAVMPCLTSCGCTTTYSGRCYIR